MKKSLMIRNQLSFYSNSNKMYLNYNILEKILIVLYLCLILNPVNSYKTGHSSHQKR